jgi:flagellar motility protein MotE (MotC chaperone)
MSAPMNPFRLPYTTRRIGRGLALLASVALFVSAGSLGATETAIEHIEEPGLLAPEEMPLTDPDATGAVKSARVPLATGTEVERFCSNIADAARDRRYVLQTEELQKLQQEVDKRIKLLEEKRADYEAWLKRREDFLAKAEDGVVKIYSGMRPDAAAERLAEMDATLAAGILMKIEPRKAGVILNEMERKAAAMLTGVMAAASRRNDPS